MKRFSTQKTYRIGELSTKGSVNPMNPVFKGNRYYSLTGQQLKDQGVTTLVELFEKNPLNLPAGKNFYIYEVDEETSRSEYWGEGSALPVQTSSGLSDGTSAVAPSSPTPPGRGQGTGRALEMFREQREQSDALIQRQQNEKDNLMQEIRMERDEQRSLINRLIDAEKKTAQLEQQLAIELQMLQLKADQRSELDRIERDQLKREAARTSLADDLDIAGMIQSFAPYLAQMVSDFMGRRNGGSAPPQYQQPQVSQPAPINAVPAQGVSDPVGRDDLGMQAVKPIDVSVQSQAETRM